MKVEGGRMMVEVYFLLKNNFLFQNVVDTVLFSLSKVHPMSGVGGWGEVTFFTFLP